MAQQQRPQLSARIVRNRDTQQVERFTLLCNSKEDVVKKKHKKQPFAQAYVQLLHTPLEAAQASFHTISSCHEQRSC